MLAKQTHELVKITLPSQESWAQAIEPNGKVVTVEVGLDEFNFVEELVSELLALFRLVYVQEEVN